LSQLPVLDPIAALEQSASVMAGHVPELSVPTTVSLALDWEAPGQSSHSCLPKEEPHG